MEERPFATAYDEESGTLAVSGSIDELSGVTFREALQEHSGGFTRPLVVDLSDVDFMPSLAVGVLAVAMENARQAGHELDVFASPGTIAQRVLQICGLPYRSE